MQCRGDMKRLRPDDVSPLFVMADRGRYGAVMGLQDIPRAISVARQVMDKSEHNILVGRGATAFGQAQGFPLEDILEEVG